MENVTSQNLYGNGNDYSKEMDKETQIEIEGEREKRKKSVKQLQRSKCELNSKFGAIWCV